jgi:calcineurin-like phosphoesterase family protein
VTRKIFVVSDTHFNHQNLLGFETSSRGARFAHVNAMNRRMIENWNSVVNHEDIVYHLGDVYLGNQQAAADILKSLNGRKRLILGNHDVGKNTVLHVYFQKIYSSRIFTEYNAVLTHLPVHPDSMRGGRFGRNIHGHIHDHVIDDSRYINVCVEQTNYFPVDIDTL